MRRRYWGLGERDVAVKAGGRRRHSGGKARARGRGTDQLSGMEGLRGGGVGLPGLGTSGARSWRRSVGRYDPLGFPSQAKGVGATHGPGLCRGVGSGGPLVRRVPAEVRSQLAHRGRARRSGPSAEPGSVAPAGPLRNRGRRAFSRRGLRSRWVRFNVEALRRRHSGPREPPAASTQVVDRAETDGRSSPSEWRLGTSDRGRTPPTWSGGSITGWRRRSSRRLRAPSSPRRSRPAPSRPVRSAGERERAPPPLR